MDMVGDRELKGEKGRGEEGREGNVGRRWEVEIEEKGRGNGKKGKEGGEEESTWGLKAFEAFRWVL